MTFNRGGKGKKREKERGRRSELASVGQKRHPPLGESDRRGGSPRESPGGEKDMARQQSKISGSGDFV